MPADVTALLQAVDAYLCRKRQLLWFFLLSASFPCCRQFIEYGHEGHMSASPVDELKRAYIVVRVFKA